MVICVSAPCASRALTLPCTARVRAEPGKERRGKYDEEPLKDSLCPRSRHPDNRRLLYTARLRQPPGGGWCVGWHAGFRPDPALLGHGTVGQRLRFCRTAILRNAAPAGRFDPSIFRPVVIGQ